MICVHLHPLFPATRLPWYRKDRNFCVNFSRQGKHIENLSLDRKKFKFENYIKYQSFSEICPWPL